MTLLTEEWARWGKCSLLWLLQNASFCQLINKFLRIKFGKEQKHSLTRSKSGLCNSSEFVSNFVIKLYMISCMSMDKSSFSSRHSLCLNVIQDLHWTRREESYTMKNIAHIWDKRLICLSQQPVEMRTKLLVNLVLLEISSTWSIQRKKWDKSKASVRKNIFLSGRSIRSKKKAILLTPLTDLLSSSLRDHVR